MFWLCGVILFLINGPVNFKRLCKLVRLSCYWCDQFFVIDSVTFREIIPRSFGQYPLGITEPHDVLRINMVYDQCGLWIVTFSSFLYELSAPLFYLHFCTVFRSWFMVGMLNRSKLSWGMHCQVWMLHIILRDLIDYMSFDI